MDYNLIQSDLPSDNSIQYNIGNIETFYSCYTCANSEGSNISPDIINYINNQLSSYLKTSDAENLYVKIDTIDDLIADLNNQFNIINTNFGNIKTFLE